MKIDFYYGMDPSFGPTTHEERGVGGTENFLTHASEYLARVGHEIRVYNKVIQLEYSEQGVPWANISTLNYNEPRDVLWALRARDVFQTPLPHTRLKCLYLADTESYGLGDDVREGRIDLAMFVGQWQADKIMAEEVLKERNCMVTSNGVALEKYDGENCDRVAGKCIHMATPERGLEPLLDMWPAIQEAVPYAELHLFSSFKGWGVTDVDNRAMCEGLYKRVVELQEQGYKIFNYEHGNAGEIRKQLMTSELYLYPTRHFSETNCMCALEASASGVPVIATARAALIERVIDEWTGYLFEEDENHDANFIAATVKLLKDADLWRKMSANSVNYARVYDYEQLAWQWQHRWNYEIALRG
jgi:glycosyltransferase involved in cell wall biosynthesis